MTAIGAPALLAGLAVAILATSAGLPLLSLAGGAWCALGTAVLAVKG